MKIAVKDLELALEYIKKRSTDVHADLKEHHDGFEMSFYDVDDNRTIITVYNAESTKKPRVTQQDYLDVVVKNLKK